MKRLVKIESIWVDPRAVITVTRWRDSTDATVHTSDGKSYNLAHSTPDAVVKALGIEAPND